MKKAIKNKKLENRECCLEPTFLAICAERVGTGYLFKILLSLNKLTARVGTGCLFLSLFERGGTGGQNRHFLSLFDTRAVCAELYRNFCTYIYSIIYNTVFRGAVYDPSKRGTRHGLPYLSLGTGSNELKEPVPHGWKMKLTEIFDELKEREDEFFNRSYWNYPKGIVLVWNMTDDRLKTEPVLVWNMTDDRLKTEPTVWTLEKAKEYVETLRLEPQKPVQPSKVTYTTERCNHEHLLRFENNGKQWKECAWCGIIFRTPGLQESGAEGGELKWS